MEKESKGKKSKSSWLTTIGILLIVIAAILIIWFFAHGQTTVTGSWSDIESTESLICDSETFDYPFFTYDQSRIKSTRINAIFSDDSLKTISLIHTLYYSTTKEITDSENINHADLNISYGKNGLDADALGAKFTKTADALQFSIYANVNKISSSSAQYFALDGAVNGNYTISLLEQTYVNKGFNCTVNNKSKED